MHGGSHYTVRDVLVWTRREIAMFALIASVPTVVAMAGVDIGLPWPPIAVLGTSVAFVTGFRGNASYGRLWEARQIWGSIVNASRHWFVSVRDFHGGDPAITRDLAIRHVAWLTALRHQLREARTWERMSQPENREFQVRLYALAERQHTIAEELALLLSPDELAAVLAKKNRASALLARQSEVLRGHLDAGRLSELRHIELVRQVGTLYAEQGKAERIKNFPYPRQFATLNLAFVWMFICILPFGVVEELERLQRPLWLTIPVSALVAWVFHTMDKIGVASENPFEGGANDIPITTMSRNIEIELRDLMGESPLPAPRPPAGNIQT